MSDVQSKSEEGGNPRVITQRVDLSSSATREELLRAIQSQSIPSTLEEFYALLRLGRNHSQSTK